MTTADIKAEARKVIDGWAKTVITIVGVLVPVGVMVLLAIGRVEGQLTTLTKKYDDAFTNINLQLSDMRNVDNTKVSYREMTDALLQLNQRVGDLRADIRNLLRQGQR